MPLISTSVIAADIGYNIEFRMDLYGSSFTGIFYRADVIADNAWETLCSLGADFTIHSTVLKGITSIDVTMADGGDSIVTLSVTGDGVMTKIMIPVPSDDSVTREIFRRLWVNLSAASAAAAESSD